MPDGVPGSRWAPPGCGGMDGMGSGVDLGDAAAAHPHPSHRSRGDSVPPPRGSHRPLPVWDEGPELLVSDPAVVSSRTRPSLPHPPLQTPSARLCQATALALLPRRHRFPASLQLLGTTLAVPAAAPGAWDPPAPGEEAASLGGQEEAALAGDTLPGPGSPPRKESAAGALGVQRGPPWVVCG